MATLIYRGAPHVRTAADTPRVAHALIYRGASHDGLSDGLERRAVPAQMCYRGVRYLLTAGGRMVPGVARDTGRVPASGALAKPV